jgi:hypothetical protein
MVETLQRAVAAIAQLPETDQERIGEELLAHVEKLQKLRADLQRGIDSLRAGKGSPLDLDAVITRARQRYGSG